MSNTSLAFFLLVFILSISEWEDAKHGACHKREKKYMCFCYFDCGPPKLPPGTPPPLPSPPRSPPPPPEVGKGELCEKQSNNWTGKCLDTVLCNYRCSEWEDAKYGACHKREKKYMCFCYFDCGPPKSPPGTPPSPPSLPGSPPPPKGDKPPEGGQPPPAEGRQPPLA
ncbi:hypothetical protein L6452_00862 [Arctium lappa]|uniref:Uncharacterized protein n=1 Tax=Arctium lappa TaxID=4217 RepID=A0ACB9FEJ8_ARCLA|nr:hypothetical protein L6452_00862 [Arctium lappa]